MKSLQDRMQEMVSELALRDISQVDIAEVTGVTKAAVNLWLNGSTRFLKLQYAVRIEEAFGYRAIWLVLGQGPKLVSDGAATPTVPSESWPFSVPYRKYLALSMSARKRLDDKVSDFIEGVLFATSQDGKKRNAKTGTSK